MKESNEELELPLKEIKIGRETYKIHPGDYIKDNGSCLQFCSYNVRVLKHKDWTKYISLVIPKTTIRKIILPILHLLEKKEEGDVRNYYFKKIKLENGKD